MDRVLIGNTGAYDGSYSAGPGDDYFNRENLSGLFISKPGQNVMSCNSADLLFSTDIASNGFLMVLGSGNVQIEPGTQDSQTGVISPTELTISTGIYSPHEVEVPLMVNWVVISGMGRKHGSNIYDCLGVEEGWNSSWDGQPDSNGLPDYYNPIHTSRQFDPDSHDYGESWVRPDEMDDGVASGGMRLHFWEHEDVGVNNYHLSNTVITNDPSSLFWTWFEEPTAAITAPGQGAATWGQNIVPGAQYSVTGQFIGRGSLIGEEYRNTSVGLKTTGDFLYCEGSIGAAGDFELNFTNGHSKIYYYIAWMVFRERGAG